MSACDLKHSIIIQFPSQMIKCWPANPSNSAWRKLDNRPISGTVILENNIKGPGCYPGPLISN